MTALLSGRSQWGVADCEASVHPIDLSYAASMDDQENGAQGRNRTSDTAIFNRMLYQLSYLGLPLGSSRCRPPARTEAAIGGGSRPVHPWERGAIEFLRLSGFHEAVDVVGQRIAPGLVAREAHLAVDVDIEDAAGRAFQLDVLLAALLEFRPDTQGLGFVASGAAVFDEVFHGILRCMAGR
jgi:hypothetical protein